MRGSDAWLFWGPVITPQTNFGPGAGLLVISSSFACMTKVRLRMEFFPTKEVPLGITILNVVYLFLESIFPDSIFPKSPACLISVSGPPWSSLVGLKCPPLSAQLSELPSWIWIPRRPFHSRLKISDYILILWKIFLKSKYISLFTWWKTCYSTFNFQRTILGFLHPN